MGNLIKAKQGRKGIASWIAQMITALFAIGAVAFLYFLIYSRSFDIHAIVLSAEAQRHTINMAQILLSSDKLVYEEDIIEHDEAIEYEDCDERGGTCLHRGICDIEPDLKCISSPGCTSPKCCCVSTSMTTTKRFHRAVFDKNKLDKQLINEDYFDTYGSTTKDSEIEREVSYPNTATDIVVYDIDSGTKWILSFGDTNLQGRGEFFECLKNNIDRSIFGFLPNPFNAFILWDFWDATECFAEYATKIGVFEKEFPVLIKVGDELHVGRLLLRLMET